MRLSTGRFRSFPIVALATSVCERLQGDWQSVPMPLDTASARGATRYN